MTYIQLPDTIRRPLAFYLAMEEYVARNLDFDDAFFMWQVEPTVIFGRNQLISNEVNLDYCRHHGIATYRRKSGGGCVYADMGNVMLSYVTSDTNVGMTFNRYINLVTLALVRMGIDARATGRNDILIGGRKVSGNAFYHLKNKSIVHGTLLYDTNMENMEHSLTPSTPKLASKGVASVRQHIALLKDYTPLTLAQVMEHIRSTVCGSEFTLPTDAITKISEMEQEYRSDEFIWGSNPSYTTVCRSRVEGVGDLEARLVMKNGKIRSANLLGDYFLLGDLESSILRPLRGATLERESLEAALPPDLSTTIMGLSRAHLIDLLLHHQDTTPSHQSN